MTPNIGKDVGIWGNSATDLLSPIYFYRLADLTFLQMRGDQLTARSSTILSDIDPLSDPTVVLRKGSYLRDFRLAEPVVFDVEEIEGSYVATCPHVDLAASGETYEEAIAILKSTIVETHQRYLEEPLLRLGKHLNQQRETLGRILGREMQRV